MRATHSLVVLLVTCLALVLARPAFAGLYHWKRFTSSQVRRQFFDFEERESSPPAATAKRKKQPDPRTLVVKFVNHTLGMDILETDVVYATERSSVLYECALKLGLADEEEPMVFKGAAFTREQAEENAALMALYRLQTYSAERTARKRANGIKQLSLRATEAFGKLSTDSAVALDVGSFFNDAAFVLRALADVRGLASAQLVVDEDGLVQAIRMSRSSDAALVDETTPTFRAVGRGSDFWEGLKSKAKEQLLSDGTGAVQLLLDGGIGSRIHSSVIVLIRNLQQDFMQESPNVRVNFFPRMLGTEDADGMSVTLWISQT